MSRCAGLFALVLAAATGCAAPRADSPQATSVSPAPMSPAAASLANGRSIFETGRDSNGTQIVARSHPLYPSCGACHHVDGSGGVHLPGGAVSADLRYKAMVTDQKRPYTLALTARAIATGIDNNGQPLNPVMPRWKLSQRDLHDVASYVMTKLK
jgi:mono/diheme cytochrome c family protein